MKNSFLIKLMFYSLSMMAFAIIILILAFPFSQVCDAVTWKTKWEVVCQNWFSWFTYIFFVLFIFDVFVIWFFCTKAFTGSPNDEQKVLKCESIQSDALTFLAAYFIPLVSFNINMFNDRIVLLFLFTIIGIIYICGDLFYQNPTLILINFRIYKIECKIDSETKERIIICRQKIEENDFIEYISLGDKIWFAKKII